LMETVPEPQGARKQPLVALATMLLVRFSVAESGPKVPTKIASGAQGGEMLPIMEEFRTSITPSVRKKAPPYQPNASLPLMVLFMTVALPSMRKPPPTLPASLLLIVLLRDVGADELGQPEPGALPLLSHALLETWKRQEGGRLTLAGYAASCGVQGAIARNTFLRLTELGEGTEDTRRRVRLAEMVPQAEDEDEVQAVLQILADARLVTTSQDEAEVAHEALIRDWPTLHRWLEENKEGLRIHRHLTAAAKEWLELDQDPDA
jgi:hypothetical protein